MVNKGFTINEGSLFKFRGNKPLFSILSLQRDLGTKDFAFTSKRRYFNSKACCKGAHQILKQKGPKGPTKELLLTQASNSIERFMIHIKWPLMRNNRPFSTDDFSAFVSWFLMGHALWISLGTTTFVLVGTHIIYPLDWIRSILKLMYPAKQDDDDESEQNTKRKDDGLVAYLTNMVLSNGLGVDFEFNKGEVLPTFHDGKLRFKNLKVSTVSSEKSESDSKDQKYTFTGTINQMDVSLSFREWYEGRGLINELEIKGLQGKLYNFEEATTDASRKYDKNNWTPSIGHYGDIMHYQYDLVAHHEEELRLARRRQHENRTLNIFLLDQKYEISNVKVLDSYVEMISPSRDTSLNISIFNGELPRVRGSMLLIDFFNASNVTGTINDSMFTIHKRQEHGRSGEENQVIRFKLNGINLGNLSEVNPILKLNWIANGNGEIIADIRLIDGHQTKSNNTTSDQYKSMSETLSKLLRSLLRETAFSPAYDKNSDNLEHDEHTLLKSALAGIYQTFTSLNPDFKDKVEKGESFSSDYAMVNFKIKFYNLKASMPKQLPVSSSQLPFISLPNLRSLVAFVNNMDHSEAKELTIKTTAIEKLDELRNVNKITDTKVFDEIIYGIYEELQKLIKLDEKKVLERKSQLWSHSLASQLLLFGLGIIA